MYLGFVQFSLPKLFTSLSPIYFILLITFYSPSNLQSLPKKFPSDCIAGHLLVLSGMFLLLGLRFPSYSAIAQPFAVTEMSFAPHRICFVA